MWHESDLHTLKTRHYYNVNHHFIIESVDSVSRDARHHFGAMCTCSHFFTETLLLEQKVVGCNLSVIIPTTIVFALFDPAIPTDYPIC